MKSQLLRCFPALAMLCIALLTVQCKSSKKAAASTSTETESSAPKPKTIRIEQSVDLAQVKTSPTKIDSAWIAGNNLHLKLLYGGGCKEHRFELLGNGFMMKSLPPQTPIKLLHDNNDDHCRELIKDQQVFNIQPLQALGGKNELVIRLDTYETPLTYRW